MNLSQAVLSSLTSIFLSTSPGVPRKPYCTHLQGSVTAKGSQGTLEYTPFKGCIGTKENECADGGAYVHVRNESDKIQVFFSSEMLNATNVEVSNQMLIYFLPRDSDGKLPSSVPVTVNICF